MAKSVQPRPLAAAARLPRRSEPPYSSRPSRRRYRPRMGTLTSGFEAAGVRRNRWGSGTTRHYKPGATDAQRILVRAVGTQIKKLRRPIGLQRGGEVECGLSEPSKRGGSSISHFRVPARPPDKMGASIDPNSRETWPVGEEYAGGEEPCDRFLSPTSERDAGARRPAPPLGHSNPAV